MTKPTKRLGPTAAALALCIGLALSAQASAADLEAGKKIAFDRSKGNCLTCHHIEGGTLPGNIGPPLIAMKSRFPDKAKLRAQIWDATAINPHSIMPPLGRHRILSEKEIDLVTDYIYSL
ncbi:sulfur oxidation c-type cytochrome SoxX [Thiolapillus sp.]